jgi:hypothetical protein
MKASALPPSREQSPDIWWSPEWGVIWSDGRVYFRADGDRVAEFFHLPSHAIAIHDLPGCCCGECLVGAA